MSFLTDLFSSSPTRLLQRQSYAKEGVKLVTNTNCALLAGCAVKVVDIQLQKGHSAAFAKLADSVYTAGNAVTAATTVATMAVAVVDTVSEKAFAEARGQETWSGAAKRNIPGLATAVGATFITGAALPEAVAAWAVYKVFKKTWNSICEFGEGKKGQIFDYQPAVEQAKAARKQVQDSIGKCCKKLPCPKNK